MRKTLISAALLSAAAMAAPASAQYYPNDSRYYPDTGYNDYYGGNIQQQLYQLRNRVQRAVSRGRLSNREYNILMTQVGQTERLHARYLRGGLNQWEVSDLQRRILFAEQRLRRDRRDWVDNDRYRDGRYDNDRYDDDDRYEYPYDDNR
jgi:hypothetical protein